MLPCPVPALFNTLSALPSGKEMIPEGKGPTDEYHRHDASSRYSCQEQAMPEHKPTDRDNTGEHKDSKERATIERTKHIKPIEAVCEDSNQNKNDNDADNHTYRNLPCHLLYSSFEA
jgi:hypothetical protein